MKKKQPASRELPLLFSVHSREHRDAFQLCCRTSRRRASCYDLSTLDYNCPGSTSFSLGGKFASYFSNSSGIRSVTK